MKACTCGPSPFNTYQNRASSPTPMRAGWTATPSRTAPTRTTEALPRGTGRPVHARHASAGLAAAALSRRQEGDPLLTTATSATRRGNPRRGVRVAGDFDCAAPGSSARRSGSPPPRWLRLPLHCPPDPDRRSVDLQSLTRQRCLPA